MSDLNRVTLSGRLVDVPELKFLASGTAVARIRLACHRARARDGARQDETTFVDVEVYGKSAEALAEHKQKGAFLVVDGRLRQHSWESRDGQKRSRLAIVAEHVGFGPNTSARAAAAPAPAPEDDGKDEVPF
jgi:single-strand DNA-binding protein